MNYDGRKTRLFVGRKRKSEKEKVILYNINYFRERLTPLTGDAFNGGDASDPNGAGDPNDVGDSSDATPVTLMTSVSHFYCSCRLALTGALNPQRHSTI